MNKYIKTLLFFSIIAVTIINYQISRDHLDDLIDQESLNLYDDGYYDAYNHNKPELKDDEDYMEGYNDAKKDLKQYF